MNKDLLFQLYAIHSPSGSEKKMRRFIRKYITENCGDVTMVTDNFGNLLCTKGESDTYPCLASHMDQVQKSHSKDFQCVEGDDVVFGYSAKSREQQGLGADDKNGIYICLECLKSFDVLKVAFFVEEEVGCGGSGDVDMKFFKDCRFIIQPDRRGGHDLITSMFCGDVCSEKFIKAIGAENFGYKENSGTVTDVGELVERGVGISCLNLSCGYYEAHSDQEFTVLSELQNCLDFVMHIVSECREVYPFEVSYGGWGRSYSGYGRKSYGCYGKWYETGKWGKNSESVQSSIQTEQESQYYDDDYDYYFDGGYYDSDVQTMEELFKIDPNLTLQNILQNNVDYFNAPYFLRKEMYESQLADIYIEVKDCLYDHSEFWNEYDGSDDDDVVFPVKNVS